MTDEHSEILASAKELKSLVYTADQIVLGREDSDLDAIQEQIVTGFARLCRQLDKQRRSDEETAAKIGEELKRDLLPYILLSHTGERMYSKPRGYAGDYLTIKQIYENHPRGFGRVGPILDRCFLNQPAAKATRNRRQLLFDEIINLLNVPRDSTLMVTSLACGPGAEVMDVFDARQAPIDLEVTLLDIDLHALAHISDEAEIREIRRQLNLLHGNLVYVISGRQQFTIPPQDLVYSHGLTDYFGDEFVVGLLNYMHGLLKPGGKAIIGNVHPDNSDKALLDYILDWPLIHRTESDMNRLFSSSYFGRPCDRLYFESEHVILFAEAVKS